MANGAVYSSLSTFRDIENVIVGAALNSADIYPYVDIIQNVKGPTRINVAEPVINFSTTACNRTPNSGVTYSWVDLTPCTISDFSDYCGDSLTPYLAKFQEPGSMIETIPFAQFILEMRGLKWSEEIAKLIVQGDTTSSTLATNLRKCDGILKKLYDASASTTNISYVTLTSSNARAQVKAYAKALSGVTGMANKTTKMFLPYTDYMTYLDSLDTFNSYNPANFAPTSNGAYENGIPNEMKIVGTNCSIVGLVSLNGASKGWISAAGAIKLGTDLEQELKPDAYNFWWSQDDGKWYSELKAKIAPAIARPTEIVRIG